MANQPLIREPDPLAIDTDSAPRSSGGKPAARGTGAINLPPIYRDAAAPQNINTAKATTTRRRIIRPFFQEGFQCPQYVLTASVSRPHQLPVTAS
jgi:hypothetical protein